MGCCLQTEQDIQKKPEIKDYHLTNLKYQKSKFKKIFEKLISGEGSFLKFMYLQEYCQIILNPDYNDIFFLPTYLVMMDIKILKNHCIFEKSLDNEIERKYFLDFHRFYFENILKVYKFVYKDIYGEKPHQSKAIPAKILLTIGFTCCNCSYRGRIEFLFNLLANYNYELENNNETKLFFRVLFSVCSGLIIATEQKLYDQDEVEEKNRIFSVTEFKEMWQIYEVKDAKRCVENGLLPRLFGDSETIGFDDFSTRVRDKNLNWILCGSGIRDYLEDHNK